MACALTQGYNLDCRTGSGGLKTVRVIEFDSVSAITEAVGVISGITKVTGKKFYNYKLVLETGDAEETLTANRDNGTTMVKQTVKFPINKMSVSVRNELLLLAQNRLIIVVEDENGYPLIYGKEKGLMITTISAKTGVKLADRNGYELVFEGDEKTLASTLDAPTVLTLETPGA